MVSMTLLNDIKEILESTGDANDTVYALMDQACSFIEAPMTKAEMIEKLTMHVKEKEYRLAHTNHPNTD